LQLGRQLDDSTTADIAAFLKAMNHQPEQLLSQAEK
jgi:hypothetical protein